MQLPSFCLGTLGHTVSSLFLTLLLWVLWQILEKFVGFISERQGLKD